MTEGVSILELARIHHEVLLEALRETPPEERTEVATAASEFFLEVLATVDMTQRSLLDGRVSGRAGAPGRGAGSGVPDRGLRRARRT